MEKKKALCTYHHHRLVYPLFIPSELVASKDLSCIRYIGLYTTQGLVKKSGNDGTAHNNTTTAAITTPDPTNDIEQRRSEGSRGGATMVGSSNYFLEGSSMGPVEK